MTILSSLLLSLILTIVLTPILSRMAMRLNIYDMPDERKVHKIPIPRIGGIAIAIGAFTSIVIWAPMGDMLRAYLIGASLLVGVGIVDDWKGLSFKIKFVGQIAAALIAIFYGGLEISHLGNLLPEGMVLPQVAVVVLTIVTIVGITNAINLSDGLDGLAGGISLLSFAFIGYLAFMEQDLIVAIPALALVGAIFGFLRFNTFPATLFMGDTGSLLLGFSAAFLSLALTQGDTALSPLLPLIILGFPILDTLTVMGERISQGRSPFAPDKNHFHHRLMRMGLFHSESVFVIYIIQAGLITAAYLLRFYSEWVLLIGYLAFAAIVLAVFHWADATGWKPQRFDFIDRVLKGKITAFKARGLLIKMVFRTVAWGVPALLIFTCFLPSSVPPYISFFAAGLLVALCLVWFARKVWLKQAIIVSLYLFIPLLVYLADTATVAWMDEGMPMQIYQGSYLFFVLFGLLTLRFTNRKKGFRPTPMHFLVLLFPLVFWALPDLRDLYGVIAVKIIILYFCYEIIMGEIREHFGQVAVLTAIAYLIVAVRGVVW